MHAETFAYLIHNLPYDQKSAPAAHIEPTHGNHPLDGVMIEIPAGYATLGQKAGEFGWDNEFDQHRVNVPAFAVGKYKVTNGEYLKFVEAGLAAAPHFWTQRDSGWLYRGMFSEIPLPPNAPVYVTYRQAAAYARWRGKDLLTEPQFHRAAYETSAQEEHPYPWGASVPNETHGNFDLHHWDPVDVDATPGGDSALGVSQLVGNGWEWTRTPFGPFQGFEPFPFYPGYSKNFFDEEHYVMKGASPGTAACFLRSSFRNWFRPDYPHVYASFRLTDR
jgi:formylglycine-generating enzyme required for sulfatase activity